MKRLLPFFFLILSLPFNSFAQEDYGWWVNIHQWDGITPWNQYMTMSADFMGPNALPVPEIKTGQVDSVASLAISFDHHQGKGDRTQNIFLKGVLPLFENRMSIEMDVVPIEWFNTDTITRDRRAARTRDGKGDAGGDIYISTTLQLIRNKKFADVQLRIALKTASGTRLRDARYTDTPGYFTDLSFGKSIFPSSRIVRQIRFYADAGFLTYQTHDIQNLQNDCFMYGAGVTINLPRFSWSNQLGGYTGYLNNGDSPMVYRTELRYLQKNLDVAISFQQGLNDYDFSRFRISLIGHLMDPLSRLKSN